MAAIAPAFDIEVRRAGCLQAVGVSDALTCCDPRSGGLQDSGKHCTAAHAAGKQIRTD